MKIKNKKGGGIREKIDYEGGTSKKRHKQKSKGRQTGRKRKHDCMCGSQKKNKKLVKWRANRNKEGYTKMIDRGKM